MFDFLRNLTQSAAEKRQEALSAYLDGALSARQRQEFERRLAEDADLQRDLDAMRSLRQTMQAMPQRSVPRSFTLDPASYGVPRKEPLVAAYPVLRAATALTAFFFVIALAAGLFTFGGLAPVADMTAQTAVEAPAAEPLAAESMIAAETGNVQEEAAMESLAVEEAAAEAGDVFTEQVAVEATQTIVGEAVAGAVAPEAADLTLEATAAVLPTASPMPTPTQSGLPRPAEALTAVPERAATLAPLVAGEESAPLDAAAQERATAVLPEPSSPAATLTIWQWLQIGLGSLLVGLLLVTWLARRRL